MVKGHKFFGSVLPLSELIFFKDRQIAVVDPSDSDEVRQSLGDRVEAYAEKLEAIGVKATFLDYQLNDWLAVYVEKTHQQFNGIQEMEPHMNINTEMLDMISDGLELLGISNVGNSKYYLCADVD